MDSFANFSLTEQKNTHMTHLEDKVIYGGADGTRQAINALRHDPQVVARERVRAMVLFGFVCQLFQMQIDTG